MMNWQNGEYCKSFRGKRVEHSGVGSTGLWGRGEAVVFRLYKWRRKGVKFVRFMDNNRCKTLFGRIFTARDTT
jgi:hypothetical protein